MIQDLSGRTLLKEGLNKSIGGGVGNVSALRLEHLLWSRIVG